MPLRRSLILGLSILVAIALGLPATVLSQSASKQSSKKTKVPAKSQPEKKKPQTSISDMEKERTRLNAEAAEYEKKFKKSKEKESVTLTNINKLEQQINIKRKLIKKLSDQERRLTGDISDARSSIGDLEHQLESLKSNYARYVRSVYKYGRVYDVELLFSSKSVNQLYIRIEYLKRFSEQRAKDLANVVHNKTELEDENRQLETNLQRQHRLLAERKDEESSLKGDVTEHRRMLESIKKDTKFYRDQADEKRQAAEKVKNIVADLIEREKERKDREAAAARSRERVPTAPKTSPTPETVTGAFASNKGKIPWPVAQERKPVIASKFGNQIHPVLKTVRENPGIDIKVAAGSNVLAVADGEVSILIFIPGYGNTLILNNYDGYRTIYAHLSEITVVESQKVKAGEKIAQSGDSVEGPILHFEIWWGQEKQNPEIWLAKQR
ncbi:MAG: peptidoglycan DD-metalloendopeptidase family protein [Ignavibacteriales bacterium]|nr:peptidoglycan DD-metalloendopeptidase family protein [Ignavibacteriales bacterium]